MYVELHRAFEEILRESSVERRRKRHCFFSHSYIKIISKENPIEIKNSAYWFKCPVIII